MARKVRIGITRDIFNQDGKIIIPGPGLTLFDDMPEVEYGIFPEFLKKVTAEQIQGFDAVITLSPRWTRDTLAAGDQLLSIHRCGVGYDNVDVSALREPGVILCITPNAVRRPMATAILTFILSLSLRLFDKDRITRSGRWEEKAAYLGSGLTGKTLGSVGVGNIGHELFRLAKPLDMIHIAYDPYAEQSELADARVQLVDMDTVLAESDFLNVSCPLNEETRHLIGERALRKMKKSAYLINTARGPVLDEAALTKALQEGWIRGAGLDVFEQEPTPSSNPLLELDNVIATPHALGHTDEIFTNMWREILAQISQIIRGEAPMGLVNSEVWNTPVFQSKLSRLRKTVAM